MKKKQFLFVLLAIIIGFSNCKKSKQLPITPVDNTNKNIQLLLGNWKLTAMFSERPHDWNGDGTQETDMYYFLEKIAGSAFTYRVSKKTLKVKAYKEGEEGYAFDVPTAVSLIEMK